ncbi:uncharacterized protein BDZ83DRAFT_611805 [Colletotrichum acutatum]|uniref:Uncharacterized protein n=1 Tax=Glomerella acutata TaxID=27357 RepID=A0AAD8UTY7_GLOAC|nr:uncharacterized protein BDZ83DRAFT_611805 [Colletotrichum acutatum]KAK1727718.1 hypothetical protein BDZ83DRAFT_611805 [Colletotrichum acutatum]
MVPAGRRHLDDHPVSHPPKGPRIHDQTLIRCHPATIRAFIYPLSPIPLTSTAGAP